MDSRLGYVANDGSKDRRVDMNYLPVGTYEHMSGDVFENRPQTDGSRRDIQPS